jgi:hypothetical protein
VARTPSGSGNTMPSMKFPVPKLSVTQHSEAAAQHSRLSAAHSKAAASQSRDAQREQPKSKRR